jgi:hypothetical protein
MALRRGHRGQPLERLDRDAVERRPDRARADERLDLSRRPVGDDPAAGHQDRPVGVGVRLLEVVRGEEERLAGSGELADRVPERPSGLDVHAHGRLVEDEQIGIAHERDREAQALRLAAAQPLGPAVGQRVELRQ